MATCQIPWTDGPLVFEIPDQQFHARIQAPELPELGEPRELVHPGREEGLRFVGATKIGTPVWVDKELAEADFALGAGGCIEKGMAGRGRR